MEKENLKTFSLFFGFVLSLLGGYYHFGLILWAVAVLFFALLYVVIYASYRFVRKWVLFVYESYLESWWQAFQVGTGKRTKGKGIKVEIGNKES